MDADEQLTRWLAGDPVHDHGHQADTWTTDEQGNRVATDSGGQCCPDFSCCLPALLWPQDKRQAFVDADDRTRSQMLAGALGDALAFHEIRKVHIAGQDPPAPEPE